MTNSYLVFYTGSIGAIGCASGTILFHCGAVEKRKVHPDLTAKIDNSSRRGDVGSGDEKSSFATVIKVRMMHGSLNCVIKKKKINTKLQESYLHMGQHYPSFRLVLIVRMRTRL